jgi:predicted house-cleaning noncanonical NTP pyrophosphatase (MazG superfamily)
MGIVRYNKLVRDWIPDIIKAEGSIPKTHRATTKEYANKLDRKLKEETDEYLKSGKLAELADILEVVYAISALKKTGIRKLETMRKKKAAARGTFRKRIVLEEVKS